MPLTTEEIPEKLRWIAERVEAARNYLNFDALRETVVRMEREATEPGFWDDTTRAGDHMRRITQIKGQIEPWESLGDDARDALELSEMADDDAAMQTELLQNVEQMAARVEALETRALMNGPHDTEPAYVHIHAGAGGTESCDWAQMLLRMITRWCEHHAMTAETMDLADGDEAGIRSATLLVKGDYAYGQLKAEAGIHRLVRISPFDTNKRRHTSFCSIHVWPEINEDIEVDIKDEDLKVDTYRASGAGGQHVNKTSSAVRITHLPSKIVVQCQNERSQHQNRAVAMKMLRARLYQMYEEQQKAEQAAAEMTKSDISWGNQIRSYVFQPYQMVKDHRTGCETGNVQAVMDGALDAFIEAYLRWNAGLSGGDNDAATVKPIA